MSGVSKKDLKAFVKDFNTERQAQEAILVAAKQTAEAQFKPFYEFRQRGFFGRLLWLVTGR